MHSLETIEMRRYESEGPTVVVLHGGPGAPGSAAGLALALADHFQVLEPLQRRSGEVPLTVSRHVDDLAAVAPAPAVLIGWSWGAMLGLSFAARYPERVSDLVLVGCGTYDDASRGLLRRQVERQLGETGRQQVRALEERLARSSDQAVRDAILGEVGTVYMCAESYARLEGSGEGDPLPADDAGHHETWNDVLRLQRDGTEPAAFRAITAPVLMIHGDVDPHPGPATRDLLRRYVPQLEYVELERCGHEPWHERYARETFVETLRSWLSR